MKLKSVMLLPLMVASLYATTATNENVTKVYVADFDRAPDSAGLKYWVEKSKFALEDISQSFFDQKETKDKYPDSLSTPDFVNTIYKNAFNRDGDPDGITYWSKELTDGKISRGNMILAVVNGAKDTELGNDLSTINNKTEVGMYFAASGSDSVEDATTIMDGITDDDKTVTLAKESIDNSSPTNGKTTVLTYKADTATGTAYDDKFIGVASSDANESETTNVSTYNKGDKIDGGAGSDTLTLTFTAKAGNDMNSSVDPIIPMSAVENVIFKTSNNVSIDTTNWTGVENYTFDNNQTNVTNVRSAIKMLTFNNVNQTMVDANLTLLKASDGTLMTGSSDTVMIKSTKAKGDANITVAITKSDSATGIVETFGIDVTGNSGLTGIKFASTNTVVKTVTVSGDSNVTLDTTGITKITSVDASALLRKKFTYTSTGIGDVTIKGGTADDNITALLSGDDTIIGGKGADDINITGAGMDTIQVDATNDIEDNATTGDTVEGFVAGTDKISIVGLPAGSSSNYIDGNETVTNITDGLGLANELLSGSLVYANVQNTTKDEAYLFFDVDNNGKAEGVITFKKISDANLTYSDIK